jgi:hypothetical protein
MHCLRSSVSAPYEQAELGEGIQEHSPRRWLLLIARLSIVCLRFMQGFSQCRLSGVTV